MAAKEVTSDSASGGRKLVCYSMEMKKEIIQKPESVVGVCWLVKVSKEGDRERVEVARRRVTGVGERFGYVPAARCPPRRYVWSVPAPQ